MRITILFAARTLTILTIAILSFPSHSEPSIANKSIGIELYNQYKVSAAIPFLQESAKSGDIEAAYYLGESIRKKNKYITPEAAEAYESAAMRGDLYSMIRLGSTQDDLCHTMNNCPPGSKSSKEWSEEAKKNIAKKVLSGNAEAMYLLYITSGDESWLLKSANAGFGPSQYLLASQYNEGKGFFVLPSARRTAVESLMKASAESGYPQGMMGYAARLLEDNDLAGYRYWNEKAAETGYVSAIFGLGANLSGRGSQYGYSTNLIKAYALMTLLEELDGGGGMRENAEGILPKLIEQMSESDIAEAKTVAVQWKANHPPLSYFPPKIGY